MLALVCLLAAIATHRLTVHAVEDDIFDRPRRWVSERSQWAAKLLSCPWCISMWLGAPVAAAVALTMCAGDPEDRVVFGLLLWWAMSTVAATLYQQATHRPEPIRATLATKREGTIELDGHTMKPIAPPEGAVIIGSTMYVPLDTRPEIITGR